MHEPSIPIEERGNEILSTPLLNKGTAFTQKERDALDLNGLLPSHISTLEEQLKRSYLNFQQKRTPLGKYSYLTGLLNRNELLFYQLVARHVAEMLPIIYTPTVGEAAVQYSQLYSQRRGFYVSYPLKDKIDAMIKALPHKEIDVVVVTDGERILGLGDQGIGGMTIPIGKLALYTVFGGIHPSRVLPVFLDVGTNNPDHLKNDLYLGCRTPRITGSEYNAFVDAFIHALHKRYPKVLLQWEDFGKTNARPLLERYRKKLLSFNDDIQGTAGVVLAALFAALNTVKRSLSHERIVILGAGSAGLGIAETIVRALLDQGVSSQDAHRQIYLVDIHGLIHFNTPGVDAGQKPFAKTSEEIQGWSVRNGEHITLQEVVANAKPTVLIGVSAQGGAFSQSIIEEMHKHTQRPIVFPLSNPTTKSEAAPQDLLEWTHGNALIATGSPFQPITFSGKTYQIAQCNNVFIFPGVGLGALAVEATEITDGMFFEAAKALAALSPALHNPTASLFPPIEEVRKVSFSVALAVAKRAIKDGVAKPQEGSLETRIANRMWDPQYPTYTPG
jgi:malate dehydrogenase (oxaloacetate-decarboxylating)